MPAPTLTEDIRESSMAPDKGTDTGVFSRYHLEMEGVVQSLKTRMDNVEKDVEAHQGKYEKSSEKVAKMDGAVTAAIPDLQKRLGDAFDLIGEAGETANVYYGQIREMAKDLEKIQVALDKKASKDEVSHKADKAVTEEGIKNCFLWVKAGFVGVAITFLLWVLAQWGGFFKRDVQKPQQASPVGVRNP